MTYPLKRQLQQAFSLIELLVVITIVSILSALVFMNGPSILEGMGFTGGGRLLLDTLNYAREAAVTQSGPEVSVNQSNPTQLAPTVVAIRTTGPNAWQRLAIFSSRIDNAGKVYWVQLSKWQNLPQRTFIDSTYTPTPAGDEPTWTSPANKIAESTTSTVAGPDSSYDPSYAIKDGTTTLTYVANTMDPTLTDYCAIEFLTDGSLQNTNNIAIRLVKGHIVNGAVYIEKDSSNQPVDWEKLIIVQTRGHVKVIRKGQ